MSPRKPHLRALLQLRAEWLEEQVFQRAAANGYAQLTPAMVRMFGHMGGRPIGVSELARRLAVSKQAVHQVANEVVRMGLVELIPSEQDGRVKLLRFTQRGWAMSDRAAEELQRIEAEIADKIGRDAMEELRRLLALEWPGDDGRNEAG